MNHELVVRGGTVVTAADSVRADVGVDGGRIAAIEPSLAPGRREIDATGLLVLPGGVDVHTHLDAEVGGVRSVDDFESGTMAAACGGVTTICDYAWQARGQTLTDYIEDAMPTADRERLEAHLALCDGCTAVLAQLRETIRLTGTLTEDHIPEPQRDALREVFRSWRSSAGAGPA